MFEQVFICFGFFLSQFMSSLRDWQRNSPSQIRVRLPTVRSLSVYALQSNYEPHPKFLNDLQRCVRGTSIVFFFAKAYTEQTHSFIFVFRREPPLPRIAGEWVLEGPQCVYGYAKLLLAYMETKHETVLLDLRVSHPGCIMHQEHE